MDSLSKEFAGTELPVLPEGYSDTSNTEDEVCILDPNGQYICDILRPEDAQAARYAIAKWEAYYKSLAQGLFSVAALLFNGNRVLAVSRKNNHSDLGLAGGKIDPGETPEQALVRELREETGITALRFMPIFEDPCRIENGEVRPARTYLVYSWEGEPKAMENAVVEWVMPRRLLEPTNSFCAYNEKLFKHLEESVGIHGTSK